MIYIGSFIHMTNQQEPAEENRRYGEFNMIVDAETQEVALAIFKARIASIREMRQLFDGRCRIFLIRLLSFDAIPTEQAAMFDYTSTAGDPVMPYIACASPNEGMDGCHIFDWRGNAPEIDGRNSPLFLEFEAGA